MIKEKVKKGETNAAWFVETARNLESSGNVCAAKSWLLTGKTLFPKDFNIHVNIYLLKKYDIYLLTYCCIDDKEFYSKCFVSFQYEEFMMEKGAGRVQKCARLFYDM